MKVPRDEAGEGGEVVAAAGEGLVHGLLHEVLVHALDDEACFVSVGRGFVDGKR